MLKYIREAIQKKIARRITKEYSPRIDSFDLQHHGIVQFANWTNPLVKPFRLTAGMVDFFRQYIKEGDLAIDIGANIGDTTVPMALCTGTSGLTLGFDPNPIVMKILQANAALNQDRMRLEPVPFAISENEEEFFFISSEASFANGGISPTRESIHGRFVYPEKIKGVHLQQFLEAHYADRLFRFSFIKIDTEGYDKEIIKSIRGLLSQYKPVIVAESFGKATHAAKMELYEVIADLGYDIHYFEDFDIGAPTEKLTQKSDMTRYRKTINICATPK